MAYGAVAHRGGDDVAVAVRDLAGGETIRVRWLDGSEDTSVEVVEPVPLGHKVALRAFPEGHAVTEYSETIGKAVRNVTQGGHVHVHNVKSARWSA